MRGSLVALAAMLMVVACGGPTLTLGTTPSSVAMQSSDAPKGLSRCSESGDIDTFLKNIKSSDPTAYATDNAEWTQAKKDGATSGTFQFFAATKTECANLEKGSSSSTPTAKVIGNFVIQFKDSASATKAFTSESILGFKTSDFKGIPASSGVTTTEGTKTGLGDNSIVVSGSFGSSSIYVAAWANKAFYMILVAFNVDIPSMKKIATAINGRVH